jgi:hypothetical protein
VWTCFNIKSYLIDQGRYKTFSVLNFYVIVVVIEFFRATMYLGTLLYEFGAPGEVFERPYIYNVCYVLSCYAKIIMGFFQAGSMIELYIRISSKESPRQEMKVWIVYMTASIINLSALLMGIYLAVKIQFELMNFYKSCDASGAAIEDCDDSKWADFFSFFGEVTGFYVAVLLVVLLVSYYLMASALQKYTIPSLKTYKKTVQILFFLLTTSYTLRAVLLFGQGHYYNFLNVFWRDEGQFLIWPCIDALSIIPVLVFHHKNFSKFEELERSVSDNYLPIGYSDNQLRVSEVLIVENQDKRESSELLSSNNDTISLSSSKLERKRTNRSSTNLSN